MSADRIAELEASAEYWRIAYQRAALQRNALRGEITDLRDNYRTSAPVLYAASVAAELTTILKEAQS